MLAEAGHEGATVVEAEVTGIISFFRERDPFLAQDSLEQLEMDRLIVDDGAVEIENDGPEHAFSLQQSPFVSTRSALESNLLHRIIIWPITGTAILNFAFAPVAAVLLSSGWSRP